MHRPHAAEGEQRGAAPVHAALHRDLVQRAGHGRIGHAQHAEREVHHRDAKRPGQRIEDVFRLRAVQRDLAAQPPPRVQVAEDRIRVAHRRLHAAPAVAGRPRIGAWVPERRELFPSLSVAENLSLGAYTRGDRAGIATDLDMVFTLFPRLRERRQQHARTLSGGEQQMLAIGRGLMSRPRYLVLDEPSLGLAPILIAEIFRKFAEIRAGGATILLVEQNASAALDVADHGYVLETGIIRLEGSAASLAADEAICETYLR